MKLLCATRYVRPRALCSSMLGRDRGHPWKSCLRKRTGKSQPATICSLAHVHSPSTWFGACGQEHAGGGCSGAASSGPQERAGEAAFCARNSSTWPDPTSLKINAKASAGTLSPTRSGLGWRTNARLCRGGARELGCTETLRGWGLLSES